MKPHLKAANADTPATAKRQPPSGDTEQISEGISEEVSAQVSEEVSEQVSEQIQEGIKGRTPDSGGAAQPAAAARVFQPPAKTWKRTLALWHTH